MGLGKSAQIRHKLQPENIVLVQRNVSPEFQLMPRVNRGRVGADADDRPLLDEPLGGLVPEAREAERELVVRVVRVEYLRDGRPATLPAESS